MATYSVSLRKDLDTWAKRSADDEYNGSVEDYIRSLICLDQAVVQTCDSKSLERIKQRRTELEEGEKKRW